MKLYFLNKGTHKYPRVKHSLNYPDKAYKQGNTIYYDIEKEFTNDGDFNAYEQAEEWSNAKYDEIEAQEESTHMYAIDCGVRY